MKTHPYLPTGVEAIEAEMLKELGLKTIEELFTDIPNEVKFKGKLNIPGPYSELEVKRMIAKLLEKNVSSMDIPVFLGAGVWPHYVPAVVDAIVGRLEFATSYTPYQAEVSQGILQAQFEYQSMICELTGMDVANASMYDWATSLGEAALMASRITKKTEVVIPYFIHPERKAVLKLMIEPVGMKAIEVNQSKDTGEINLEDLKNKISKNTAAVYIENPSYLGFLEEKAKEVGEIAHENEALYIVGVDPTSLGLLKAPGDYGADIVVGEGQPLGNSMNYGGPLLGIFACKEEFARQMPGRIIGLTTTKKQNQRAFCMALQTREQYIRREKATSSICTNEALCAVAAAVYLSLLGPKGLKRLGEIIMIKSSYAMKKLKEIAGIKAPLFKAVHFKEFTVNFDETGKTALEVHKKLLKEGVHGGKIIKEEFPELGETMLYCVTEVHLKEDIDKLSNSLKKVLEA
ncbi:aminomethyl-transferring glycine dehydrogenase subunit GcvPA [Candidatus Bathyarchaeota archaeon]|nr:aminomethyl-transferring glycine dehydrogenase subunit GcvPA [Candidatus Bathyarchaeota archaeon]